MKKIIYSSYTKFTAVLLAVLCAVLCVNTVIDGLAEYSGEEKQIYRFERSFNESRYIASLLYEPADYVYDAYRNVYRDEYDDVNKMKVTDPGTVQSASYNEEADKSKEIEKYITNMLSRFENSEEIDYFISINDKIFTNCGAAKKEDILGRKFYILDERNSEGEGASETSSGLSSRYSLYDIPYTIKDRITVCTGINDAYAQYCENIWDEQAYEVQRIFTISLVLALSALLLMIYLIAVCGKKEDGEYSLMWIDSIWTEVHLISFAAAFGCAVGVIVIGDELLRGFFPLYMAKALILTLTAVDMLLIITSLLSIIRKIKCKKFIRGSIICTAVNRIWKICVKTGKYIRRRSKESASVISKALSKKTGVIFAAMLLIYTAVIGICGIMTPYTVFGLIFAVGVFGFSCFVVAYRAKDIDEIKKGADEIRSGNLTYKIPELKSEDLKLLAKDVNEIAAGLDESVSAKLRAEKLKTDLITNVSHDLKTPITSIISYTELLSKLDNLPPEAMDYIRIIAKKSDRLKNLTQDLFDISKVQSGNESIVFEKLDISLLINQSLGEHDSEIQQSELNFCVDTAKELYVSADGRKMSRVMSNLISNILKYTMKNTRVFISAAEKGNEVVVEFKNIASYPIDFDADEIVTRFVRGDESRTAEGNGLGLAIAKSYTEACKGKFEVVLDGDMFKVIIKFKKCGAVL